jgi:hypothetical protein
MNGGEPHESIGGFKIMNSMLTKRILGRSLVSYTLMQKVQTSYAHLRWHSQIII